MLTGYPSLTDDEFAEACQSSESRCHDHLDGTMWRSVQWLDSGELRIKQDGMRRDDDSTAVEQLAPGEELEEEEDDIVVITRPAAGVRQRPALDFSIVLSLTYRVPVLWFAIASDHTVRLEDLDRIYTDVVSPDNRGALQNTGVMGGISIANHPLTDRVMFFIHPCNTLEALSAVSDGHDLTLFQYLLLWCGIIGGAVGLHVPISIVM